MDAGLGMVCCSYSWLAAVVVCKWSGVRNTTLSGWQSAWSNACALTAEVLALRGDARTSAGVQ
jgi:hypothetical protein